MLRLSILCVTALSCSANNPVKTSVKSQLHQNKDVVKSRLSDAKLSLNSTQDQFNKTILSKFNNADLQKYGIQGSSEMQGLGDGACGLIIECDLDPIDCRESQSEQSKVESGIYLKCECGTESRKTE